MSHIENEFNKRFNNQALPNEDFDAEGLWNDIAEDLDQEDPKKPVLKTRWITELLIILMAVSLLALLYFNAQEADLAQDTSVPTMEEGESIAQDEGLSLAPNAHQNKLLDRQTTKTEATASEDLNPETRDTETTNFSKTKDPNSVNTKTTNNAEVTTAENLQPQMTQPEMAAATSNTDRLPSSTNPGYTQKQSSDIKTPLSDEVIKEENTVAASSTKQEDQAKQTNSAASKTAKATHLPALPTNLSLLESDQRALPNKELLNTSYKKTHRGQSIQWMVNAIGGVNTLHFNSKSDELSDLAALKNTSEKNFVGLTYGLHAGVVLKDRWLLKSGIEYHQLWSKFDYKEEETIKVFKEDQLVKVWIDEATNDTINRLYKDTMINALSTREVVHYNQYQRFSIPIEIGIQQQLGKLIYGVSLGAAFNFTKSQSGKTLNALGEIVAFEEEDSTAPFKSFGIGVRISPTLGYQLSERWTIALHPQWMWQQRTNFDDTDLKLGVHQFNLNLGLAYTF